MGRKKLTTMPARAVRVRHDLQVYLSALAWDRGVSIPEVADSLIRGPIEAAFAKLGEPIRDRYLRDLAQTTPAARRPEGQ